MVEYSPSTERLDCSSILLIIAALITLMISVDWTL
jgi:hypothetical protein